MPKLDRQRKTFPWLLLAIPVAAVVLAVAIVAIRMAARGGGSREGSDDRVAWRDKSPEAWCELLSHRNPIARQQAREALVHYGNEAIGPLTETLRRAPSDDSAALAAEALGEIGPPARSAAPAILDAMDSRPQVRDALARALGGIGDDRPTTFARLEKMVRSDPEEVVRIAAAESLGRLGEHTENNATPVLVDVLTTDDSMMVRVAAADALGRIGPKASAAIPALRAASDAENFTLADAARTAVQRVERQ